MRPRTPPTPAWDGENPPGAFEVWRTITPEPRDLDRHLNFPADVLDAIAHIRLRRLAERAAE